MKIYITRHGETLWNKENRRQGWKNSDLTEMGIEDAKRLGERLKSITFDRIYCSPLGRAIETARYIKGEKETPIIICEDLKEINFGVWEGMSNAEIDALYAEQNFKFWNKPHEYVPVEGETYDSLINRTEKVLNQIIEKEKGNTILIVTHGVTKKAIYKIVKDIPLEKFWGPPFMHNTGLSILEVEGERMHFVVESDISHLEK